MVYLDGFNTTLRGVGNGTTFPVLSTATLSRANSNGGPQLLNSGYMTGLQLQLQELQATGVKAIMVEIGFPMLYEPFLTSQGQSQAAFVAFYQQVAAMVRAQGLKLVIENNNLLSSDVQAGWETAPFYQTLDWSAYQAARAQTAVTIAQTVQPDYLVVLEEPDTEAMNSGQSNVNTSAGATAMLGQILAGLQPYRSTGLKVGAGLGTWLYGYQTFIKSFVTQPMDFIDMHIYPINLNFLPNALTIANLAAAAGMPVAMTECWLNKELDTEVNKIGIDVVRGRNPFSFWDPLDVYFLQTMKTLANNVQMLFLAPSNSEYFFAYQTYDTTTASMTPGEILSQEQSLMSQANKDASYTDTGMNYYASNVAADKTPPSVPTGLTGNSGNPTTAYLTWNASTDAVGVAGYYVLRNGESVGTTGPASFQDAGLTEGTTYTYAVQAFDLGGNISRSSQSIAVTTADVTPPSPPENVAATANSCEKVTLTWTPATDNTVVNSYLVFWGISPDALSQVARTYGTSVSYVSYPLSANTTYYYALEAADKSGNTSVLSSIVAVTTPAPPGAPTGLAANPLSDSKISLSWSAASSGGLPVQYYHVYRGSSPSTLSQIAVTLNLSSTDTSVTASTKYYYAVQAADTAADLSPMSKVVPVTAFAPPSAPANLTATPASTTRVNLTWSPSVSGGLPVQYYHIYRGSSPSNLTQIAVTALTSHTDVALTAATQYYYAVQAADTVAELSPMSAAVPATTFASPGAPGNLAASAKSTTKISLSWSASVSGGLPVQYYHVYRGSAPASLTQIAVITQTSYVDAGDAPATKYYYAIQAGDTAGDLSPKSAFVAATTLGLPAAPTNVTATAMTKVQVSIAWTAAQSGMPLVSYSLFRGNSPSSLTLVKTIDPSKTSTTDYPVTAGTTYYYGLQAKDQDGNISPMSTVVEVSTPD